MVLSFVKKMFCVLNIKRFFKLFEALFFSSAVFVLKSKAVERIFTSLQRVEVLGGKVESE